MMQPLGIYISIPFCRSKCTYCNFASGVHSEERLIDYVDVLCKEIADSRARASRMGAELPRPANSLYFGGGTPSILSPKLLDRIWQSLEEAFDLAADAEITFECAPGQLEDAMLECMLRHGTNRISFGVQSFIDKEAASTGRLHTRDVAVDDCRRVLAAGVSSVNVDLIAGLPHQTKGSWLDSLEVLASIGADHASIYMLEVDEDSRLGRELMSGGERYHSRAVPEDGSIVDMYQSAMQSLSESGFRQYEISNFSRPGRHSIHNEKYWRRLPYIGFGVDAHSMLRTRSGAAIRFANPDSLDGYTAFVSPHSSEFQFASHSPGRSSAKRLSRDEEAEEVWFLGLRRCEGVDLAAFKRDFGSDMSERWKASLDELLSLGFIRMEEGRAQLTLQGILLSNEVFVRLLAASNPSYSISET